MKLKKLEVNAAGGISPNAPVVVIFEDNHFVKGKGDMGTGKSSLLRSLLIATAALSKDDKDFINLDSGKLDIGLDFVGNDRYNYNVRVTKSEYKLMYEGERLPEPMTKVRDLLGPVGVSPMGKKNAKFDDIIKFLASYTTKGIEDFEKRHVKLKEGIKSSQDSRAAANKSAKGLTEFLFNETMYSKWEESEKKYIKKTDIKELSAKLTTAGNNSDKYIQNESKVKSQKERQKQIETQMAALQEELGVVNSNITIGEAWLTKNKDVKKEYDEIKKQYDNAAQDVSDYNKWQEIKAKKSELDEFETLSQKADAKEKELLAELKELRAEIIPQVKGVDLVMEDEYEDGKLIRKQGLYMDGKNVAQLSESEFWSLVLQIWRKNKVRLAVIDNYQDLGSQAVEILGKLVKDGAYVLVAEMSREQKTLEIEYQ